MIVLGQTVRIEVNRPYEQSALARILVLVKDAAERKAPAELFIRRFARFYTPAVIVLALLIVTVPAFTGLMTASTPCPASSCISDTLAAEIFCFFA